MPADQARQFGRTSFRDAGTIRSLNVSSAAALTPYAAQRFFGGPPRGGSSLHLYLNFSSKPRLQQLTSDRPYPQGLFSGPMAVARTFGHAKISWNRPPGRHDAFDADGLPKSRGRPRRPASQLRGAGFFMLPGRWRTVAYPRATAARRILLLSTHPGGYASVTPPRARPCAPAPAPAPNDLPSRHHWPRRS